MKQYTFETTFENHFHARRRINFYLDKGNRLYQFAINNKFIHTIDRLKFKIARCFTQTVIMNRVSYATQDYIYARLKNNWWYIKSKREEVRHEA